MSSFSTKDPADFLSWIAFIHADQIPRLPQLIELRVYL